ncbi:MAG TPA: type II toxin-antitoxin system HicB family antitoxin [Phycisphaerae bacterium]|nr:type II toxin-antitoxin system HicB family antitoxin [Phycisphaerae bacterium]
MVFRNIVHKDRTSDYGVTVPDQPGCFSAGSSPEDALAMAKEAIELHLEGLIEEGLTIPKPVRRALIERARSWAIVNVDVANLRGWAKHRGSAC